MRSGITALEPSGACHGGPLSGTFRGCTAGTAETWRSASLPPSLPGLPARATTNIRAWLSTLASRSCSKCDGQPAIAVWAVEREFGNLVGSHQDELMTRQFNRMLLALNCPRHRSPDSGESCCSSGLQLVRGQSPAHLLWSGLVSRLLRRRPQTYRLHVSQACPGALRRRSRQVAEIAQLAGQCWCMPRQSGLHRLR
jgi:hypothetical protein